MFIHIGGDTVVSTREVIGIFDVQAQSEPDTGAFLRSVQKDGRVEVVEVGEMKSFVVTENKVYFSPISSLTLKKRAQMFEGVTKGEFDL